jgi:hypothetical protein
MRTSIALICGLLSAAALSASDLSGIWVGQIPTRNGDLQDISFKFAQQGSRLEGKAYGDYGSTPISEGVVSGDLITFVVKAPEQAGNQINETRLRFTGSFRSGEIELMRERESSTNAGNAGGVQSRGDTRVTVRLKRLI